jgi:hypothetical protein
MASNPSHQRAIEVESGRSIVPASELAGIFRSKSELYRFLTVEGETVSIIRKNNHHILRTILFASRK